MPPPIARIISSPVDTPRAAQFQLKLSSLKGDPATPAPGHGQTGGIVPPGGCRDLSSGHGTTQRNHRDHRGAAGRRVDLP